jgi:Hint domain
MPTRNWTGGANGGTANHPVSGVWSTALNWDTAPVAGDTVQFGGNPSAFAYTVTLDINAAITRVTFNSNSALATLAVGTHTLTVTGSGANIISMNANAEITLLGGTVDLTAADGGIQTAIGSIIAGEGTITAGSTTNGGISGGGAIIASGGVLDLQSRLTGTTTLTVGGGASDTLKLERASTATSASFNGSTGKLEVGTAGTLTLTSALAIGSGNTVALDGAGTTQLTDNNGVSLTGGTLSGTGSVAANTNISGVGTVAINISNAGTITANGGTLDLTGTVSGRTLAISTTDGSDLKIDGTATSAAITINNAAQTLEVGATGALTISTAESITNGKIQLDGGTLTDAAGLTVGTLATLTGSGTVAANIGAGTGTITASNGVLNLTGSVTSGPSFAIGTASASTLLFSGTATASNPISINDSHQTLEIGSAGNLTINGAESITNGTVKLDGGTLRDSIGTTEQTFTVGSGGTLTGFGNAPNTIILAGGTVAQSSGGVLKTVSITGFGTVNGVTGTTSPVTGATQIVASGGLLDLIGTVGGSQLVVDPNKASSVLKVDGNVTAGGSDWIDLHSANQTVEVGTAGNLTLSFLETVSNGTIKLDGGTLNANGGVLGTLTKNNGVPGIGVTLIGKGVVNGTISGSGVVEGQAGVLTVSNNVTSSTILLEADSVASSVLALDGTVASGISFDYLNTGGVFSGGLLLGNSTARTSFETGGTIAGMHVGGSATATTDFIDIAGVVPTSFTSGVIVGSTIELFNGANEVDHFNLASAPGANAFVDWQTDGSGGTDVFLSTVTCFVAGTRVLTVTGERTVESLMQGDIVLTLADGELVAQPVRWVGQRRIDLTAHPRPATVAPVRIRRGAFADNMPHADLLVSPDHAVFVEGKLICARQLINGTTIRAEKGWTAVEYFHVELDTHAILLAEGLPAESYLDTGNRGFFANGGEPLVLHPDLTDEADYPAREAGSCAPFVSDEASVRPVWQRLAERAAALGQPAPRLATTDDPELRIVAKGRTVRPLYGENGLYIFALPKGATEVRLVSRAGSPTDARPWLDDRRCLGVDVERIVLRGANELREVPVDHPGLSQGWHAVERDGVALRRWTNGDAVLPLPVLGGPTMLEIRAGGGGMAYVTVADVGEQRAA